MIKIFILLIVFIFLIIFININKNEYFSNVQLRCSEIGKPDDPVKPDKPKVIDIIENNQDVIVVDGSIVSKEELTKLESSGIPLGVNTQNERETVDPKLPQCVGICINQHTYTKENTKNIFIADPSFLTKKKTNQNDDDIINTRCGECINNFYYGLELLKEESEKCQINN